MTIVNDAGRAMTDVSQLYNSSIISLGTLLFLHAHEVSICRPQVWLSTILNKAARLRNTKVERQIVSSGLYEIKRSA
jgi:hypothetical protein